MVFGPNLPKKNISRQKHKKISITIGYCIFELVLIPNFSLNWQIFRAKFAQKVYFQSKTEKVNINIKFCNLN